MCTEQETFTRPTGNRVQSSDRRVYLEAGGQVDTEMSRLDTPGDSQSKTLLHLLIKQDKQG